jgi:TonB family protein
MALTVLAILASFAAQGLATSQSQLPPNPAAGHQLKEPKKVKHVAPDYPEEAWRAGLDGVVVLECSIDDRGRVTDARVSKGVPPLSDAAIKAVKKWRYEPLTFDGKPTSFVLTVTLTFNLGADRHLRLEDLLGSFENENEFIRESAAIRLGGARAGPRLSPHEMVRIVDTLWRVAEHDQSERVRSAAARGLARLEGN